MMTIDYIQNDVGVQPPILTNPTGVGHPVPEEPRPGGASFFEPFTIITLAAGVAIGLWIWQSQISKLADD